MEIFFIGCDSTNGKTSADRVGSKAANLARLARIGLRVPPAFVLGTDACRDVTDAGGHLPETMRIAVRDAMARLEHATHRQFGGRAPLLVSVRSSPPISMPGMLDTVLNVGLTPVATQGLLRTTGNPSLVWDTSRRFAQSFAETVSGCPSAPFVHLRDRTLAAAAAQSLDEIDPLTLRDLAHETMQLAHGVSGSPLPTDPYAQLEATIAAVFRSWTTPRAIDYRRISGVDDATGTAVIVQAMVFGNGSASSGSGVGFTRNPSTGADELYIDFLFDAQGDDVVSGRHRVTQIAPLAALLPEVNDALLEAKPALEDEFGDMQDFEFTVQNGELYFLQSRSGKRTAWAALQIAADLVRAQRITPVEALRRLEPYDLDSIQRLRLATASRADAIASAVPAGIGVAVGAIVFDCGRAQSMAATQPVILVRPDLTTDDVAGLAAARGILTTHGGRTSHAAVVARHLGKVCLAGCASLRIDETKRRCSFGARTCGEGDVITLDGESGLVYAGAVSAVAERPEASLEEVRRWRAAEGILA
jgi:pyruvate,orthophosphate dikinase